MTLRDFIVNDEYFGRDWDFRLYAEGKEESIGKYEYNELVKLNYPVANREVVRYELSPNNYPLCYVWLKEAK